MAKDPKSGTKSHNKTRETDADVDKFIAAIADRVQQADARTLIKLMQRLSGEPPRLWGPSIVGFGSYHYHYESGRQGDAPRISFSPRKGKTAIYIVDGFETYADLLAGLGKHQTATACLYVKRLADVDVAVLEDLIAASLAEMAKRYPE